MLTILPIILPVFGLVGLGFLARYFNFVTERVGEGLSEFVYAMAIPCLILATLGKATIPATQPWGYWAAYFGGAAIVWIAAALIVRYVYKLDASEEAVAGFCAAQSNLALVGIPIISQTYGDDGLVPLFLLLAVHLPIMLSVATVLVEGRDTSVPLLIKRLLASPIVIALFIGAMIQFLPRDLGVMQVAWRIIDPIGATATPCALLAMGMSLHRYGRSIRFGIPLILATLKLLVHPFVVLVLATKVFTMPPAWAGVAVLFAATPTGINAYLFAERYRSGVAIASGAISLSTVLALFTTVLWLFVLGVG
ncbi:MULTISPECIES: AEC family transporter [unclassified Chelatococcus]|uniref:AEC family transporter n=1 Tax=unclassified Chelatococcus TaxID=2638111 RepID=UPI001BCFA8DD|nr:MULTISPECIES: AEC family transporter [unclassified Chelatococcus]MBS7695998.1 AEC family transporter [Chelatococcus sp. YT9]MBX3557980.1 AEC family transporter [Chelatococcus sp.]